MRPASRTLTLCVAVIAIGTVVVDAHRRDEYLQAARLAIAPTRVDLQLDLTPGIAVADAIISEIDRDRDGVLSPAEQQTYAARVLRAIALDVDHRSLQLEPAAATFPDVDAFRRGEGTIALRWTAAVPPLSDGAHRLSYRNSHRGDVSVYLANALVPDNDRVEVRAQSRDVDQRDLTIDYVLKAGPPLWTRIGLFAGFSGLTLGAAFLLRRAERRGTGDAIRDSSPCS